MPVLELRTVRGLSFPSNGRKPLSVDVPVVMDDTGEIFPIAETILARFTEFPLLKRRLTFVPDHDFVLFYRADPSMPPNRALTYLDEGKKRPGEYLILRVGTHGYIDDIRTVFQSHLAEAALVRFLDKYGKEIGRTDEDKSWLSVPLRNFIFCGMTPQYVINFLALTFLMTLIFMSWGGFVLHIRYFDLWNGVA